MGSGILDYALLPGAMAADLEAARARGLALDGPAPGGRVRPDGQQVAWETAIAPTPDLPFLCADVTPRALRVPTGAAREHANGATGICELTIAVADLDASTARYQALLGRDPQGKAVRAFPLGLSNVYLRQPTPADPALHAHLATYGDSPWELYLSTTTGRMKIEPEKLLTVN
jgi:hypothetical protein